MATVFINSRLHFNIFPPQKHRNILAKRLSIQDFIQHADGLPVFDVRSPGEFNHAHIHGAQSLPLFTDDERAHVGTVYKQQGKQKAIKAGLTYFGPRMKAHLDAVEYHLKNINYTGNKILVHCWRGGMRSGGMAWLLELYGYDVAVLDGGYKAYRNWVLDTFNRPRPFRVLGGYTGSAKTETLQALREMDQPVIDLEALANHKGSAFGGIGQQAQPTQEHFENLLAQALNRLDDKTPIWIEDESQRIGKLNIPHALWNTLRQQSVAFMNIPFLKRLDFIVEQYGKLDLQSLIEAVERIQKRFGPNETKITLELLHSGEIAPAFEILLRYYDKKYHASLRKRNQWESLVHPIDLNDTDPQSNAQKLLQHI
jgi:tRNA 2-selenouridine synthase